MICENAISVLFGRKWRFNLIKVNLVEHFFAGNLIEPQIFKGHCLAGMIQQFHDQTDIVICLDIDPVSAGFAHRVGAQVVNTEQVADFVHDLVVLLLRDVAIVVERGREEPFGLDVIVPQPGVIGDEVVFDWLQIERVGLAGLLILDVGVLLDAAVRVINVALLECEDVTDPQQGRLADLEDGVVTASVAEVVKQGILNLVEDVGVFDGEN